MAIVAKKIKASKLNLDAMRLALLNPMRDVGKDIEKEYRKITDPWSRTVVFEILRAISKPWETVEVAVLTNDEVFGYLDKGTKGPYKIPKTVKPGKRLAFQTSYSARTAPNSIASHGSGKSSGKWTFPIQVTHPGIKPRNFSKIIAKKMQPRFKRRMEKAMKEVARASGHAMR